MNIGQNGLDRHLAVYWTIGTEVSLMAKAASIFKALAQDDAGGEVIEYAIVLGLISIAAISLIAAYGTKVVARWNSVNSSM